LAGQAATKIESFKANEGMPVFESIAELCRDNAILPLSYGDGYLTLTEMSTKVKANDAIQLGVNTIGVSLRQSDRDRYSSYKVKGQGIGNSNKSLAVFTEPMGQAVDEAVSRYRPMVILAENSVDSGQCKNRAQWESRIRAGYSRMLSYTVEGWTQSNGAVWDINMLVRINDNFMDIDDTYIISDIDFIYNALENEKITEIGVVHKDTYKLSGTENLIKTGFDA